MELTEAIKIISQHETYTGANAKEALLTIGGVSDFTDYIKDQFREGNAETLAAVYGHEVIDTIIKN